MILPGKTEGRQTLSGDSLLSSSPAQTTPLPHSLWSVEQCSPQQRAQLVMLPIEGGGVMILPASNIWSIPRCVY